jgi:putative intracellular protease/amidase
MTRKLDIVNKDDNRKQSVKQLLEDSKDKDYEEVVIIGLKDGKYFTTWSGVEDVLRTMGSFELAKFKLLE